jgi:transposase InsO family protein
LPTFSAFATFLKSGRSTFEVWAYDFVFDTTATSRHIKCLTDIDNCTRVCMTIGVADSMRIERVIKVLLRSVSVHGAPMFMHLHAASKTCPFVDGPGRFPFA